MHGLSAARAIHLPLIPAKAGIQYFIALYRKIEVARTLTLRAYTHQQGVDGRDKPGHDR